MLEAVSSFSFMLLAANLSLARVDLYFAGISGTEGVLGIDEVLAATDDAFESNLVCTAILVLCERVTESDSLSLGRDDIVGSMARSAGLLSDCGLGLKKGIGGKRNRDRVEQERRQLNQSYHCLALKNFWDVERGRIADEIADRWNHIITSTRALCQALHSCCTSHNRLVFRGERPFIGRSRPSDSLIVSPDGM